jgi:Putative methyltransferase
VLSEGLQIAHARGFDSGPFMAYVYADQPHGRTALGTWLDRRLLSRPTCRAFREIRVLAQRAVLAALEAHGDRDVTVADLAAGPAPYLLDALREHPRARALVCDVDAAAVAQAAAAAEARGLGERVQTRRLDAFDAVALAELRPSPDIVLELGLYGIYHDDALIERHFLDLARTVAPDQIVCNVQVRNPEIEYIARVWRNREGERCVWRLRPVEQILGYAAAAGYEPLSIEADSAGIYRVVRLGRA